MYAEFIYFVNKQSSSAVLMLSASGRHMSKTRRQRRHVPHSQRPSEFVRQRNERERRRVDKVNEAFLLLSRHLPTGIPGKCDITEDTDTGRGVSKINTLRAAIDYIGDLERVLQCTESEPRRGEVPDVDRYQPRTHPCIGHVCIPTPDTPVRARQNI